MAFAFLQNFASVVLWDEDEIGKFGAYNPWPPTRVYLDRGQEEDHVCTGPFEVFKEKIPASSAIQ